jgi:hypothetical protein
MHGSQMIYATALMILAATPVPEGAPAPRYACDAALTALFTPARPLMGRYEVCTADTPIEVAAAEGAAARAERYGTVEALEALDAFGAAGSVQRSALLRLYGGTRVRTVRGWSRAGGRFESITLLSPYPDATLTRLVPGTMAIRFTLESERQP